VILIPRRSHLFIGDHAEIKPGRIFHDRTFIILTPLSSVNSIPIPPNNYLTSDWDIIEVIDRHLVRIQPVDRKNHETLSTDPSFYPTLNSIEGNSVGFVEVSFGQWHVTPGFPC